MATILTNTFFIEKSVIKIVFSGVERTEVLEKCVESIGAQSVDSPEEATHVSEFCLIIIHSFIVLYYYY